MLTGGIDQPIAVDAALGSIGITAVGDHPAIGRWFTAEGCPPQLQTPAPGLQLLAEPAAQRGKIQHHPQRLRLLPSAPLAAGPQQVPAGPARPHHLGRQAKLLNRRHRHRRTAERSPLQVGQSINHTNINARLGQAAPELSPRRAGSHHQHGATLQNSNREGLALQPIAKG